MSSKFIIDKFLHELMERVEYIEVKNSEGKDPL